MSSMIAGRSAAPVMGSIRWLLLSVIGWEVVLGLREMGPATTGSWPLSPFEILLLTAMPALTAFAFVRLFLAVLQSAYGSLNTYTLTSSPWAWVFWLGLAVAMVGQGGHLVADTLNNALPAIVQHGDFGAKMQFFDEQLTHWLLGLGFFMATAVIVVLGPGSAQQAFGVERTLLALGSILTYGFVIVFIGVEGEQLLLATTGSIVLTALGLWALPAGEITYDPIGLLVMPGAAAGALTLIVWGVIAGGQPSWPW